MIRIYRWQDTEGRGPYRPGLSLYWKAPDHEARNPAMQDEFGWDVFAKVSPREHRGCAFRSPEQMREWFTLEERDRIALLGYQFVAMDVDRIVAESPRQVVFARRRPLRFGAEVVRAEAAA